MCFKAASIGNQNSHYDEQDRPEVRRSTAAAFFLWPRCSGFGDRNRPYWDSYLPSGRMDRHCHYFFHDCHLFFRAPPKLINKVPTYRLHRTSGQALVCLDGRRIYLGKWNTAKSRAKYRRVIAEWLATGKHAHSVARGKINGNPLINSGNRNRRPGRLPCLISLETDPFEVSSKVLQGRFDWQPELAL